MPFIRITSPADKLDTITLNVDHIVSMNWEQKWKNVGWFKPSELDAHYLVVQLTNDVIYKFRDSPDIRELEDKITRLMERS
jgi:hypothetical protein